MRANSSGVSSFMPRELTRNNVHLRDGIPFCANLARRTLLGSLELMEKPQDTETPERCEYLTYTATWQGITLEIRHCPCWFSMPEDDFVTQHIEIRSLDKRILPITETGYRSHFMNGAEALADFENDPIAFILWWLDEAAKAPEWRAKQEADRQLSFF